METKYVLLLKNTGECQDASKSSETILFISAYTDEEALTKVEEAMSSAFNSNKTDVEENDWIVKSLVNPITEENIWLKRMCKGRKSLTRETVMVGKKERSVYIGPKGGRYVKTESGKFVRL